MKPVDNPTKSVDDELGVAATADDAGAMNEPVRIGELLPDVIADLLRRTYENLEVSV